jgi:histone methylation protein DOT1
MSSSLKSGSRKGRDRVAGMVRAFHQREIDIAEATLARAVGIIPAAERIGGTLSGLLRRFGNQNFTFEGTSFSEAREIFRAIDMRPNEVFCDLGAGYGHVVFYGALVAKGRFRAVEILPQRCAAMRKTKARLGLGNVEIIQGDAFALNYDDVSYMFLNSPFFPDKARQFVTQLVATRTRPLTVIALNMVVDVLRNDDAFTEIEIEAQIANYRFGIFQLAAAA